ncbi:hypothetical protein H2O64_13395 [Kordia sp. YSTF-M3]|uniref:Uncharacterized protein n=1 Tax=Kordia aestuariivivens TaxID=2759037 RepID=A0ABR7QAR1_9FLAO|nr:hypothetical protein [Kordia aestuariivivens]MBC8755667.1 hypothetical protein [Kordia aestuariivivens]
MKKLTLKKIQIAAIGNVHQIIGKSENSNTDTICDNTGNNSITCLTNCEGCNNTTNIFSPCTATTPGATRQNGSAKTKESNCLI